MNKKIKMTRALKKQMKENGDDYYNAVPLENTTMVITLTNYHGKKLKGIGDKNKQIGMGTGRKLTGGVCFNTDCKPIGFIFK